MQKGTYVKDITAGAEVHGLFAVSQAARGQSRNGPYWRLTLVDAGGMLEGKIWHPLSADFAEIPIGEPVWVEGRAGQYKDQIQLTVESLRVLSQEERAAADMSALMPASPYAPEDMFNELTALIKEEFRHAPWRTFVQSVLKEEDWRAAFKVCPAAKAVHHAYLSGLLEHSLGVFKLCRRFADQYPELDRQTLLAGALFHDFGKIREFSGGLANDYTDEGRLLGHLELGIEMLAPYLAKSGLDPALQRHLKHLILSHHGELQYGAVRLPQTPEALALHYADNLDAKMGQCRTLFEQLGEEGQGWTPYQGTLGRALHRPARTPEPEGEAERGGKRAGRESGRKKAVREECLSLLKV